MISIIRSISLRSIELVYNERTVLHLACYNNNAEIVKILMTKQNIDVNVKLINYSGEKTTALILGICNEEIVKCLLSNPNIDVNMKFERKYPREMNSILLGLSTTILLLCNQIMPILLILVIIDHLCVKYMHLSLINKICVGFSLIVSILVIIYVPFPQFILTLLAQIDHYICLIINNCNVIRRVMLIYIITELISSLFDTYTYEVSPLHEAIRHNYTESAKILLSNDKIDVNSLYVLRLYDQYEYNNENDDYYEDKDVDDDKDFRISIFSLKLNEDKYITKTALNIAAKKGNTEIVKLLLLNNKIDVEAKYKSTTCYRIIYLNTTWIGLYIIESIITSLFSSFTEKSSLIIAAENSNTDVVKQLLEKSSIKNVKYDYEKLKKDKINKNNEQKGKKDKNKDDKKYNLEKFDEILELLQNFINGSKLE